MDIKLIELFVVPIAKIILTGIVGYFLTKLGRKYSIDFTAQQYDFAKKAAADGIDKVVEIVAHTNKLNKALSIDSRQAIPSSAKLGIAVDHVINMTGMNRLDAQSIVEATLANTKGEGSTGDRVVRPQAENSTPQENFPNDR